MCSTVRLIAVLLSYVFLYQNIGDEQMGIGRCGAKAKKVCDCHTLGYNAQHLNSTIKPFSAPSTLEGRAYIRFGKIPNHANISRT